MANIIRHNSAPLWRPDLYRIFTIFSLAQTSVKINTSISRDGAASEAVQLNGVITQVNGLECDYLVNSIDFIPNESVLDEPSCEYSAVLASNVSGIAQLVEYSGHARILQRKNDAKGLPEELRIHFSLPGRVRPLRRHQRQDCAQWDGLLAGLTLLDSQLRSRRDLLAIMRHYYGKKSRAVPELINISPGGVCLRTEDAIARRLMHGTDRYLFFFFLKSPLEEKVPWVFQGKKAGTFKSPNAPSTGLRIQFVDELAWEESSRDLSWKDISVSGSDNLKRVLNSMNEEIANEAQAALLSKLSSSVIEA